MIDDDFDSFFRSTFEKILGLMRNDIEAFDRYLLTTPDTGYEDTTMETSRDPTAVERIDLEDRVILIVGGLAADAKPRVVVRKKRARLEAKGLDSAWIDLPFAVDREKSSASLRNGVFEVILVRGDNDTDDEVEIQLK
ncbi:MAG: hypothetical protein HXY34_09065 [Candidatus Thorarchaeota archaeon]|nr:hypothetical protein [Candidatus Thorarchaeota archaeon]